MKIITRASLCLAINFLFGVSDIFCQNTFNLDFEDIKNGKAKGWNSFGNKHYGISLDSTIVYQGKFSAHLSYLGDTPDYHAWSYSIPAKYEGKKIKLTGYVKTEAVTGGWAGLWLRIDPGVGFDNMTNRGITGTTDWTRYEIEMSLKPKSAQQIVFGGLLVGSGDMWIDNLVLTIDDIPIEQAPSKKPFPAERDTAFTDASGIIVPELNDSLISNLEILGKIWGLLKYHHPAIAEGLYNWDNELLRMLPEYLLLESQKDRDNYIINWIMGYGKIKPCKKCTNVDPDALLKPDHTWIKTSTLSTELQETLTNVYQNRHQGDHYYISLMPNVENPIFDHEKSYTNMPYPDAGFRILALYRYWNMINYYFPYKHLINQDWNHILRTYLPLFIQAQDELQYELASLKLIAEIHDTHANLWGGANAIDDWKGQYYPPFRVNFIENQLVVTDFYNPELKTEDGLAIGDIITHIDGKSTEEIVAEKADYYPASNQSTRLRNLAQDLLRSNDTTAVINFRRDELNGKITQSLYEKDKLKYYRNYKKIDPPSYKMLDNNIGYVTLQNIEAADIDIIKDTFRQTQGIIIDIRNYPNTFVPFLLGTYFVQDSTPFVKFTRGNPDHPGEFTFKYTLTLPADPDPYKGKLVVLVNENSQSQSEYTAMAFQAGPNTTVIGSTTAGADGNVSTIMLPGGLRTLISGIGVYYPDGKETQRVGIIPNIVVEPTIGGITTGEDEVLNKAIDFILNR